MDFGGDPHRTSFEMRPSQFEKYDEHNKNKKCSWFILQHCWYVWEHPKPPKSILVKFKATILVQNRKI